MLCGCQFYKTQLTMCLSSPFHKYGKKELKGARRGVRPITLKLVNPWVPPDTRFEHSIPIEAQLLFQGLVILIEI